MYAKACNMVSDTRKQLINTFPVFNLKFQFLVTWFCKFLHLQEVICLTCIEKLDDLLRCEVCVRKRKI